MDGYRTDQVGDARALYTRLCRINPANPEATTQLKRALADYGATDLRDLRDLLISASLERLRSGSAWAEQAGAVAALWQPSGPAQDGSGRPGFWCSAPDVGTVSVRECRPLGCGPLPGQRPSTARWCAIPPPGGRISLPAGSRLRRSGWQ